MIVVDISISEFRNPEILHTIQAHTVMDESLEFFIHCDMIFYRLEKKNNGDKVIHFVIAIRLLHDKMPKYYSM